MLTISIKGRTRAICQAVKLSRLNTKRIADIKPQTISSLFTANEVYVERVRRIIAQQAPKLTKLLTNQGFKVISEGGGDGFTREIGRGSGYGEVIQVTAYTGPLDGDSLAENFSDTCKLSVIVCGGFKAYTIKNFRSHVRLAAYVNGVIQNAK
jgi:hypothetical protein